MRVYWESLGSVERIGVVLTSLVLLLGAYIAIAVTVMNESAPPSPTTTTITYPPPPDANGHITNLYSGNTGGCSDAFGINC